MNPLSSHILTAILRENKVLLNYRLGAADHAAQPPRAGIGILRVRGGRISSGH
jgi:hypothetical protein